MIDVKEILTKHHCTLDRMFPTKMENINSAIKEIITETLKEAADNAYGEVQFTIDGERGVEIYKHSITSVIDKVKF